VEDSVVVAPKRCTVRECFKVSQSWDPFLTVSESAFAVNLRPTSTDNPTKMQHELAYWSTRHRTKTRGGLYYL